MQSLKNSVKVPRRFHASSKKSRGPNLSLRLSYKPKLSVYEAWLGFPYAFQVKAELPRWPKPKKNGCEPKDKGYNKTLGKTTHIQWRYENCMNFQRKYSIGNNYSLQKSSGLQHLSPQQLPNRNTKPSCRNSFLQYKPFSLHSTSTCTQQSVLSLTSKEGESTQYCNAAILTFS